MSVVRKKQFQSDHKYIRNVLRQIELHMQKNNWAEVAECYLELGALAGTLEEWAIERNEMEKSK
jgi:Zn finger protein HypA/HybF involved in hydrogenase expression